MNLFLLRHANADWPEWNKPDDERPLTKRGKKESRQVAKFLERMKVSIDLIVTSPLPRAAQTAKIVARRLKAKLCEDKKLAPGFDAAKLRALLKSHRDRDLMIVGHEPDFSGVVRALTGGSDQARQGRDRLNPTRTGHDARPASLVSFAPRDQVIAGFTARS